jgi:copper chaperone NosL
MANRNRRSFPLHRSGRRQWLAGALVLAALSSCKASRPEPVELTRNEDACAQCRMAVSDRRFAAEVVDSDGTARFFDDLGCLVRWLHENPLRPSAAAYIVCQDSGQWTAVEAASYVRSDKLKTPMSYGVGAWASRTEAQHKATELGGELLSWSELQHGLKGKHHP